MSTLVVTLALVGIGILGVLMTLVGVMGLLNPRSIISQPPFHSWERSDSIVLYSGGLGCRMSRTEQYFCLWCY